MIFALAGSDQVYAGWGADTVYLGRDLFGGGNISDENIVYADPVGAISIPDNNANAHSDRVYGDVGKDTIFTYYGNDLVYGNLGDDTIDAGVGNDIVEAGDGNNIITGGTGDDTLSSGSGRDQIFAGDGDDQVSSGAGDDLVFAGAGNDSVSAGAGDDYVVGSDGDDLLDGDEGRDVLWGGDAIIDFDRFNRDEVSFFAFPINFQGSVWADTTGMIRIVPAVLVGASVEGRLDDGKDRLRGGSDTDWLFGGGDRDQLNGDSGDDYVDGGSGNDLVFGGAGNDTLRGGSNNDVIRGDIGIDQLFGDSGTDHLFGDAGIGSGLTQVLAGQRLFGGDGIDYLYGFSFSTTIAEAAQEALLIGDELHGGSGGDWLYGGVRSDTFYGDAGNDTIQGDGLLGAAYTDNPFKSVIGGADTLFGGSGEDKLYGGGSNDTLWGGQDSDWLEGQIGSDTLYGGSGIDQLILDVDPNYLNPDYAAFSSTNFEVFNGHFGNLAAADTPDDNATDILLVEGTDLADTIRIGQVAYTVTNPNRTLSRLAIDYNGRFMVANWRDFSDTSDPNGKPLVDQFRISGLGGNDTIDFVASTITLGGGQLLSSLDTSDLTSRSNDWIAVIDGGPGNDILTGSNARDRIDGGYGSDTIYGYGGDDQLWGDGGRNQGDIGDLDIIYGGQGNDDLLGGKDKIDCSLGHSIHSHKAIRSSASLPISTAIFTITMEEDSILSKIPG